jgi:hypothetical protein
LRAEIPRGDRILQTRVQWSLNCWSTRGASWCPRSSRGPPAHRKPLGLRIFASGLAQPHGSQRCPWAFSGLFNAHPALRSPSSSSSRRTRSTRTYATCSQSSA